MYKRDKKAVYIDRDDRYEKTKMNDRRNYLKSLRGWQIADERVKREAETRWKRLEKHS